MLKYLNLLMAGVLVCVSVQAAPRRAASRSSKSKVTQNGGEFAAVNSVPRAIDGVKIPAAPDFPDSAFSATALQAKLEAAVKEKANEPVRELLKDKEFCRQVLALDAIRTAGASNLDALAKKDGRYGAFMKAFFADLNFMRLYAGAELIATDSAEGFRVMADIWARDGHDEKFDKRLCAGIAACWGAGPLSEALQYAETLPRGHGNRCDPVWRYFFFKQSARRGVLHPNYRKLRPWEIRFIAGNRWDDESLWWLQHRINLPWDQYHNACWAAKYSGCSVFGETVQGPLYTVQSPMDMGSGECTMLHGGVCGSLSHVGAHAAAAHGIPAYTVGQPGHCAYGYRLVRGNWQGGFGGPHGGPHNWIFKGAAPTMTRLMEDAFAENKVVDTGVVLRAMWRAGVTDAGQMAARLWPHNFNLQREYLQSLKDAGKPLAPHLRKIVSAYNTHGFAFAELMQPFKKEIEAELSPEARVKWFLSLHRAIANTPPSWAAKDVAPLLKEQVVGMDEKTEAEFVGKLFQVYMTGLNDQVFGILLEWSIATYVGNGRDQIFADAFASVADASAEGTPTKGAMKDQNAARGIFAKALVAAEKAKSAIAVNALTDLAEKQGLADGCDPGRKLTLPAGERLISDQGLLSISTTSGWDHPIDHRNVLRDAAGQFHTDKETANWALVDLGKNYPISSVLVVKNRGNEWRSKHMRVSRSVDGATFFPLAENENTPGEWLVSGENQPARWIKVERLSDNPDFFHLRNILIFTKEQ